MQPVYMPSSIHSIAYNQIESMDDPQICWPLYCVHTICTVSVSHQIKQTDCDWHTEQQHYWGCTISRISLFSIEPN